MDALNRAVVALLRCGGVLVDDDAATAEGPKRTPPSGSRKSAAAFSGVRISKRRAQSPTRETGGGEAAASSKDGAANADDGAANANDVGGETGAGEMAANPHTKT